MICYEGDIVTVNENNDVCHYLVEDKGEILYVGDQLPEKYQDITKVNLSEKALLPTFVDTHQHFASFSTFQAGLNVMEADSNSQILEWLEEFVNCTNKKTLIVFGASPYSVKEKQLITREEIDTVSLDKEIMVVKYDGHACIVNTKLLEKLEKKICNLRGYHPESGEMNQEAFFEVSNYITNSLSLIDLFKEMQNTVDYQAKQGIGCVHTVSGVGFKGNLDITLENIFSKSLNNGFQLRVFPQSFDVNVAIKQKLPRIGGCFECALDGCFGSMDAALIEGYFAKPNDRGVLYYNDNEVIDFCKRANRAGLQIEMHAIGDKAFDQACLALKKSLDEYPRENHRHGIIHACLPTEQGLEVCREYGIQLLVQSAFINWKQEPDYYLEMVLGKERAEKLNPLNDFVSRSLNIAAGSDTPCTAPNPIEWIDKAVNNPNKQQALSVQEAVRMCTYNGYYATFDDDKRGSLVKGKIADMILLSRNPYMVPKCDLKTIKVEKTFLNGIEYRSCRENILKAILRGVIKR